MSGTGSSATIADVDFFLVGAMKAATSSLCDWLDAQPGVTVSRPKEPRIFVSDDAVEAWRPKVATLYGSVAAGTRLGEASTDYTKFPHVSGVPARLAAECPEAKLIYLMRHPVERSISQYRFEWLLGGRSMAFGDALHEVPGLVDYSRYALQLRQWLEIFPADRILPVFTEAFAAEPCVEVTRVLDFLEVPADVLVEPMRPRNNETSTIVRPSLARRLLRHSWLGERMRPFVPGVIVREYVKRLDARSRPAISVAQMERLVRDLDVDLAELGALLGLPGLNCATWKQVASECTPVLGRTNMLDSKSELEG